MRWLSSVDAVVPGKAGNAPESWEYRGGRGRLSSALHVLRGRCRRARVTITVGRGASELEFIGVAALELEVEVAMDEARW